MEQTRQDKPGGAELEMVEPLPAVLGTSAMRRGAKVRRRGGAVTRRSVITGLVLVIFVAAFAPYNDHILLNGPFIGTFLPIGVLTLFFGLVLGINPLLRWRGKRAYSTGELVVVLSMMLTSSAAPGSGLTRYLEPLLVSPFDAVRQYPWLKELTDLVPAWLVPAKNPQSPIVQDFYLGVDYSRGGSVPVLAFVVPAIVWGILTAALFGAGIFLAGIFRRQWVHHERLSYPTATIPLELIAEPEEGRWFNGLWRNPVLWAGVGIPVFLYLLNGLHGVWPSVPFVSLRYNFTESFAEHPWDALPRDIVANGIYFSALGIAFFLPGDVAFSLIFFLLADGAMKVVASQAGVELTPTEPVRGMGAYVAYAVVIVWMARRHLLYVLSSAWRGRPQEADEFTSYRKMVVGLLVCVGVAWGWMMMIGVSAAVAGLVLSLGLMLWLLMSRVLAETGLFFLGSSWSPMNFMSTMLGSGVVGKANYFLSGLVSRVYFGDMRETLMPFATESLRLGGEVKAEKRRGYLKWLFVALAVSVMVSAGMQHYLSYSLGRVACNDEWATRVVPVNQALQEAYAFGHGAPEVSVGRAWGHFGLGALMVGGAMAGRMTFVWWPFHPVGVMLANTWPLHVLWFSIAVGWAIKTVMLKYGGAGAFRRARPFFMGLIVGEILAVGGWMVIGVLTQGTVKFGLLPG